MLTLQGEREKVGGLRGSKDLCRRTGGSQGLQTYHVWPRSWHRPPRLPLHHATALQHWRQEACEDSDVMLRGHKWPRRSARPMISLLGFRMGGVMEGYMLWAVATSAGPPIVYGRFRPRSGELPKGTYRFIATRL